MMRFVITNHSYGTKAFCYFNLPTKCSYGAKINLPNIYGDNTGNGERINGIACCTVYPARRGTLVLTYIMQQISPGTHLIKPFKKYLLQPFFYFFVSTSINHEEYKIIPVKGFKIKFQKKRDSFFEKKNYYSDNGYFSLKKVNTNMLQSMQVLSHEGTGNRWK